MRRKSTGLLGIAIAMAMAMGMGLAACGAPASSGASSSGAVEVESGSSGSDASAGSADAVSSAASDGKSEKAIGVSINLSDDSILMFDGDPASAQLVEDMREGKTPVSCTVRYDQMGALPTVTVTDARTIREVYSKLARMHVAGESGMGVTDSYHLVSFELQDGTIASYNFEGEGILVRGKNNYAVSDRGSLWSYVRHLQDQYLHEQSAGADWLPIELEDEYGLVIQCPTSAPAGEVVKVYVYTVLDAGIRVAVNGDEDFGSFVSAQEYEFVMPDAPVTVQVYTVDEGYGS